jgi:hypothetical protein
VNGRAGRVVALGATLLIAGGSVAACRSAPNLPPGEHTCLGLPVQVCREQVEELEREGMTHGGVVAYRILCAKGPCTVSAGEGTIAVVYADGSGMEGGFGYAVPLGTPPQASRGPLPVMPACVGVPAGPCEEMALAGADEIDDWSTIAAITVRCTSACTPTAGDGQTEVLRVDGTSREVGWTYSSGAPR